VRASPCLPLNSLVKSCNPPGKALALPLGECSLLGETIGTGAMGGRDQGAKYLFLQRFIFDRK